MMNVAKMSSGKLLAMAIAVLVTPVISRLFDPSAYGIAALFIAVTTILSSVMPLSYERAAIFPETDDVARIITRVAVSVSVTFAVLLLAGIAVCHQQWPTFPENTGLGNYVWLVPLGALVMALKNTITAICVRRADFSAIAVADVSDAVTAATSRIIWGLVIASSAAGLIIGHMLGIAIAATICVFKSVHWLRESQIKPTLQDMRTQAISFADYPLFRAPARLAFTASRKLPVIALGVLFPAEVAGFFAMANRAAARPLHAVSKSVSDVLLQRTMGLRHQNQRLAPGLLRVVLGLIVTGLPVFLIVIAFGQELLSWFLGARWRDAGVYIEIMAPYLYAVWIGSFANSAFETLRLNKLRLQVNVGSLFVRTALFVYCGAIGASVIDTLTLYVWVSCAYQLFTYAITALAVKRHDAGLDVAA